MDSYGDHLFTDAVQALQDKAGMRDRYAAVYKTRLRGGLGPDETAFLSARTSFYIASVGANGWPYVQHRGGPTGFIKVLDAETIGYADYPGNKQFITTGNLQTDDRVSLFFMDYPQRARLKMIGHATTVDAADDPDLLAQLAQDGQAEPERLTTIRLTAMDWNCPKFITPRYTQDEVTQMVAPHLAARDRTIETLSARLKELGEDPATLVDGKDNQ